MNHIQANYEKIIHSTLNADNQAHQIGQLQGEIWKLCVQLAEFEFQPPSDRDHKFWWTTLERDNTLYHLVIASEIGTKDWFLWEVQVNGSDISDVLASYQRDNFLSIALKEMTYEI